MSWNRSSLLIALRIVLGNLQPTELEYSHGDVYPQGAPDGVINLSDVMLIQQIVQGTLEP